MLVESYGGGGDSEHDGMRRARAMMAVGTSNLRVMSSGDNDQAKAIG